MIFANHFFRNASACIVSDFFEKIGHDNIRFCCARQCLRKPSKQAFSDWLDNSAGLSASKVYVLGDISQRADAGQRLNARR